MNIYLMGIGLLVFLPLLAFGHGVYRGGLQYIRENLLLLLLPSSLVLGLLFMAPRIQSGGPVKAADIRDYLSASLVLLPLAAFLRYRAGQFVFVRPPSVCRCGYDLTGNTSGACPECGERI
jgi:hypothetical protein